MSERCILTLGSNDRPREHFELVKTHLLARYTCVAFSPEQKTQPIDMPEGTPAFLNCVVYLESDRAIEDMRTVIHGLETLCGRERREGCRRVSMDIDLIFWGDELCKPRDLSRPYFGEGLKLLCDAHGERAYGGYLYACYMRVFSYLCECASRELGTSLNGL